MRSTPAKLAFTLLEMLVAVAAVSLIAVGLAAIFEATGRTVTGGRRVSAFQAYAALVERQMRDDFGAMTRDGVLLIRNELANGGADVEVFEGDTQPRPRRVDELLFFRRGEFATAREPIYPGFTAEARAARIYYGHGRRRFETGSDTGTYARPPVSDQNNDEPNGRLGFAAPGNPNRYAVDWTLLRQQTLLTPPRAAAFEVPFPVPALLSLQPIADNDVQVALQPASSSAFLTISGLEPCVFNAGLAIRGNEGRPRAASGLVDAATTDLAEIRSLITSGVSSDSRMNDNGTPGDPDDDFQEVLYLAPTQLNCAELGNLSINTFANALPIQQAWMFDLLPARSQEVYWTGGWGVPPLGDFSATALPQTQRTRVRYEPAAPDYMGVLIEPGLTDIERVYRRADQSMLPASNLVPNCVEFIVEWTFGNTDPATGEVIWHGMERLVNGVPVADRYEPQTPFVADDPVLKVVRYRRPNGTPSGQVLQIGVSEALIHGPDTVPATPDALTSFFGFTDPTFIPQGDDPGLPWAWPEMVRVTMTLADPRTPASQETFQFVLETPGTPEP